MCVERATNDAPVAVASIRSWHLKSDRVRRLARISKSPGGNHKEECQPQQHVYSDEKNILEPRHFAIGGNGIHDESGAGDCK